MIAFEAIAEDLTHLGGPMGTEYTTDQSLGLFEHPTSARQACETHFKGPLSTWHKTRKGESTPDLGWVMYHICERQIK